MKATKKTETKVTGVTLELTIEEAIRLKIIMGELDTDGSGRVKAEAFRLGANVDKLGAFGYDLFMALDNAVLP